MYVTIIFKPILLQIGLAKQSLIVYGASLGLGEGNKKLFGYLGHISNQVAQTLQYTNVHVKIFKSLLQKQRAWAVVGLQI